MRRRPGPAQACCWRIAGLLRAADYTIEVEAGPVKDEEPQPDLGNQGPALTVEVRLGNGTWDAFAAEILPQELDDATNKSYYHWVMATRHEFGQCVQFVWRSEAQRFRVFGIFRCDKPCRRICARWAGSLSRTEPTRWGHTVDAHAFPPCVFQPPMQRRRRPPC